MAIAFIISSENSSTVAYLIRWKLLLRMIFENLDKTCPNDKYFEFIQILAYIEWIIL